MIDERNYQQLLDDSRKYLVDQCDLLKLDFASKLAKIVGIVIMGLVLALMSIVTLLFLSLALAEWLTNYLPHAAAYCIVGGIYLLLMVMAILLRKPLFIRPLIGTVAGILLNNNRLNEQNIPMEEMRIQQQIDSNKRAIQQDLQNISGELSQPTSILSIAKKVPAILQILFTLLPFLRKLFRAKRG